MYLSKLTIENFRCFGEGEQRFEMTLKPGLTALVGENDCGKTAVIDALRFVLGTTDQEWHRLEDTDFNDKAETREIRINCTFEKLSAQDKGAFVEHLTYRQGQDPLLHINWTAKDTGESYRGRPYRRVEIRSGKQGDGPTLDQQTRELLRATYLRPLRDADQALSAGRGSRLSQVLQHTVNDGEGIYVRYSQTEPGQQLASTASAEELHEDVDADRRLIEAYLDVVAQQSNGDLKIALGRLSVSGIGELANALLENQRLILAARREVNGHLTKLTLADDGVESRIMVRGPGPGQEAALRQLLEKLDLNLGGRGKLGLGSSNLLFIACELLLLSKEDEGYKLLLIEEPESHLHAQRQLRAMQYLQEQAESNGVQIIVTTHSPNLASVINLNNMVIIREGQAFSLAEGETELEPSDYRFLQRFLDVTKANLFFARAVMIVEGDAENILLPTLARLLRRDLTEHGVSIVNVGGLGLSRYARIFLRKRGASEETPKQLNIPVACVTDMDVMPDCAPIIIGKVKQNEPWPDLKGRRWKSKKDFGTPGALADHRREKTAKASGPSVQTFVSDEWTLEYDLALGRKDENGNHPNGLAGEVFVAASLAGEDDAINSGMKSRERVEEEATREFEELKASAADGGFNTAELLASRVYAKFAKDRVSKPVAAQYLAERLQRKVQQNELTSDHLRKLLPRYLLEAIEYVTRPAIPAQEATVGTESADG